MYNCWPLIAPVGSNLHMYASTRATTAHQDAATWRYG